MLISQKDEITALHRLLICADIKVSAGLAKRNSSVDSIMLD